MEKGWLNNKTFLKIISFAAAFVLWFYVVTNEDPPRSEKVNDVEIICGLNQMQINDGMVVFSKSGDTLSFTAHGKRSLVTGVKGAYYAKLNLDSVSEPGKYTITPEISKPEGVDIKDIEPSVVEVYIDKYVTSGIPVKVLQRGKLGDGLALALIEPAQKNIAVTLPSLALEEIAYAGLEVDMSQIHETGSVNSSVRFYDSNDNEISESNILTDHEEIAVNFVLDRRKTVNVVPDIRINGTMPEESEFKITPQSVEIYGESDEIDRIESISTTPLVIDVQPGVGDEFTAKLILPDGVHLKDGTVENIKISVKNKNE